MLCYPPFRKQRRRAARRRLNRYFPGGTPTRQIFAVAWAVLAWTSCVQAVEPDLRTLDRLHSGILRDDLRVLGAASCATASCHGGPQPGVADLHAQRGNEYTLWVENDPHAQSWRTICSDQSAAIMDRLGIFKSGQLVDVAQFNNCLACHDSMPLPPEAELGDVSSLGTAQKEGVGCAGCHGPAENWIGSHFRPGWRDAQAFAEGFVPLDDFLTRARTCATCHVGDRDRDMNHDIIAAGHPVLRFDMATYHAWLPKHWRDREAADAGEYESRLWLAGAVAAADASLALLEARAKAATVVSTWPEFAAYDCASCHHDLSLEVSRRSAPDSQRQNPADYARWDRADVEQLLVYRRERGAWSAADRLLAESLEEVERLMESALSPDRLAVADAAAEARRRLARWAEGSETPGGEPGVARSPFGAASLTDVVRTASQDSASVQSWESSSRYYLALIASRSGWPSGSASRITPLAVRLRAGLSFQTGRDSARLSSRGIGRQPASREEIQRWAEQIGQELRGPAQPHNIQTSAHFPAGDR